MYLVLTREMQRKKMFLIFAIVALASLIVLSSLATFQYPARAQSQQQKLAMLKTQDHSLNLLFKSVENSVVQVTRKIPTLNLQNPHTRNATALGSGIVSDTKGHIITNNHVVGTAKIVDVTFIDGNRYTANVVGTDIYNDLAVLKITGNLTKPVTPLQLGNSSALEVGDQVIAIGNPFGLDDTMTTGIVSQKGRLLPDATSGFSIPDVIQTDALIDPGNSGGPLLNMQGQVIGINTAAVISDKGGFSGIGLAISSNTAKRIVPILIERGNYTHPYLGLTAATLTSDLARSVSGLNPNFQGILVDSIVKGGAVDKAGLHGSTNRSIWQQAWWGHNSCCGQPPSEKDGGLYFLRRRTQVSWRQDIVKRLSGWANAQLASGSPTASFTASISKISIRSNTAIAYFS